VVPSIKEVEMKESSGTSRDRGRFGRLALRALVMVAPFAALVIGFAGCWLP
jgi:hypothetical protein